MPSVPVSCSLGFALEPVYFAIIYPSCVWEISITAVSVVKVLVPSACGVSTCGGDPYGRQLLWPGSGCAWQRADPCFGNIRQ